MKTLKLFALLIGAILAMPGNVYPKGWRGIVPLHSTCEDVKRLLGRAKCTADLYTLENETVFVSFSEQLCNEGTNVKWNVPRGTVISIDVNPKIKPKLSDMLGNPASYKKVRDKHLPDIVYYMDEEAGFTLMVFPNGDVGNFFYGPAASDTHLRCPGSFVNPPETERMSEASRFDEYGRLSFSKEKERLSYFARYLHQNPEATGYIISYAGKLARTGEAKERAARAMNYLVKVRNLPANRLKTIDGGYREEPQVELYVVPTRVCAPKPTPTVDPKDVRIIRAGKPRKNRRSS